MPERFVFRQVHKDDLKLFLDDGEIRAKNHGNPQACHQTSYQTLVDRRGTAAFQMPCGGVVNDYVPFYFSPITAFTHTIQKGNVRVTSPTGEYLGQSCQDDRIFFVARVQDFSNSDLVYCFSDYPLVSQAPAPTLESNLNNIESHVHWDVFDESPVVAKIREIGFEGVGQFYFNKANPPARMTRSQKRRAEFLVKSSVPLSIIVCIVVISDRIRDELQTVMDASEWSIPIYTKRGCYFQ